MNRFLPKAALLLAMVLSVFGMRANPVDIESVREVAVKFMNANTKTPLRGKDDLQLVTTYNIDRGDAAFHIFNTPNGFVIVSADDCATPILGYSYEGQFDVDNVPIQLQGILQDFVEQIQYGMENYLEADEQTAQQWELVRTVGRLTNNRSDEIVEPLLSTKWNQGSPYNMYVPNGYPTGCVATAMAQIMKYWEWPVHGIGEHSYQWNGQTLSANFGETTYDWDNMLNIYGSSTQEQKEAVATLMWHCGVSVNMYYTSSQSAGSLYPSTLINYFNYSDDLHEENRQDDESWMSLLKADLDLGRPVYYCGSYTNQNESHAFVCDGYDANDRFHFNYGWGGSSDGYYALNAIRYFEYNHAIFNIHPNASITRQVTASASPSDGGIVAGAGTYDIGSICTMTATANEGYTFMYWTEDDEVVSSHAEYSFCVRKDRDLVAHFGTPFPIEVMIDPEGGGTVSGTGEYDYGSTCTLTAIANEGYDFICWRRANGNVASTASTYSFTVTEATTLMAVFAVSGGEQIAFADLNVKALCVANWDTNGDGELSYSEAAAVTDLGLVFRNKTTITSFEELQYFTGLTTIGNGAFEGCRNLSGSLCIPNSVTTIGNYAFRNCSGFTGDLIIPDSVNTIGDNAFCNCSGFTGSLTIGNSVTTIDNFAFSGCSGFTGSLTIGNSVTEIGQGAFGGCSGFTGSLTLGNSVTIIWNNAFKGCSGFTGSLVIPNSVIEIRAGAFDNCNGFTGSLIIGNSVTTIEGNAFMRCSGFTGDLIIPDNVITIGSFAFQYCSGFTGNLIIGNSVTTIDGRAFMGCSGFTGSLILGNSLTTIDNAVFSGCSGFTGTLTIPNSVTTIGNYAFSNCNGFTGSLTIPNSVTSIGYNAFYGCSGFTGSLTLGNSVTTIGSSAFYNCSGFTGNLTIPNSVTTINGYAFYNCSGFTGSLTIPNSVMTIGNSAFSNCTGFTGSLTIGNSVTTIGNYAFSGCSGFIGDLTIPDSVTTIDYNTFYNCSGFTGSLTIGNSVTEIGSSAFYNCSGFTGSLTIGNSVTEIGSSAFYNCSGFTGSLTIPDSVTKINGYAFQNCSGFTGSLTIPNAVTSIGRSAFYNCSGFTGELHIPNSVTTIGPSAFYNCSGFTGDLTIPNSVITIDGYAFYGCSGLTGCLIIGNSVTEIGGSAFSGCNSLTSITVQAETPPTINTWTFSSYLTSFPVCVPCGSVEAYTMANWGGFSNFIGMCGGMVTVVADSDEGGTVAGGGSYEAGQACIVMATANEGYVFANWTRNGMVVSHSDVYTFYVTDDMTLVAHFVPEGNIVFADANVKSICISHWDTNGDGELSYAEAASVTNLNYYFHNNTEITSFEELQYFINLTEIGNHAFSGCSGLTGTLIIPNFVTTIGDYAFRDCSGLPGSLTIPNSVTTIGNHAFSGCSGFTGSLIISNSVTTIGNYAFSGCSGFTGSLTIPNSVTTIGNYAFSGCSGFTGSLTIPNSVVTIGHSAFSGCSGFTGSLTIPNSVATIGYNAFSGCSGFTGRLTISNSVTTIGNSAFYNCSGFTGSLTIGNSVTTIGNSAFSGCSGFTGTLNIPNSVTEIGGYAFSGCSGFIGSLTIPNSVTTIGYSAFSGCSGFTGSLTIPNSVTSIGDHAFYYCSGFTGNLTIGDSVTEIGYAAFGICRNFTSMKVLPETPPTTGNAFYSGLYGIPVYVPCGSLAAYQEADGWSNFTDLREDCLQTQIVTFVVGWNWFSTYIEVDDPVTMLQMVEAALGENGVAIKSSDVYTEYDAEWEEWFGDLDEEGMVNEQMYKIMVSGPCTLNLQGTSAHPADHPITIVQGWNWIGFPSAEAMSLDDAFANFAQEGDIIRNSDGETPYDPEWGWYGDFETLEPGQGYMYYSSNSTPRALIFPSGAK